MNEVWNKVKTAIKENIPSHSYRMWIEPIAYDRTDGDAVVLLCPNFFSRKRVQDAYGRAIETEFRRVSDRPWRLQFEIGAKAEATSRKEAPADELKPDKQLSLPGVANHQVFGRLLRRDFTFDRFVVGSNNRLAYSAAMSVASQDAINRHSLYLLSQTGLGKSHLSQAIGHHIACNFPHERVYYITAEEFTSEMVRAFRSGTFEEWKERYRRQCDVLLLEDIHFLTGKERTQIELAMALDYLLNADKRIIFTSCYLPADIPKLNDQLRSRLMCGLISNIEPPDFQTRYKIIQQKAVERGTPLPREVAEYLASELSENVRQLESGLIGVTARSSLTGEPINLNMAQTVILNIAQPGKAVTVDMIKKMVCKHFNISVEDIVSKSRKRAIVRPRQVAIYLARKYTDQPLQVISKSFNRYHATAIHSISTIKKGIKVDTSLKRQIEFLCEKIESEKN